jgi:hypothetical protein
MTSPFGAIQEMQRPVAKNATGCNGPGGRPTRGMAKIPVEIFRRPATVMQKPRAQKGKCTTQRDAKIGAPSTEALAL